MELQQIIDYNPELLLNDTLLQQILKKVSFEQLIVAILNYPNLYDKLAEKQDIWKEYYLKNNPHFDANVQVDWFYQIFRATKYYQDYLKQKIFPLPNIVEIIPDQQKLLFLDNIKDIKEYTEDNYSLILHNNGELIEVLDGKKRKIMDNVKKIVNIWYYDDGKLQAILTNDGELYIYAIVINGNNQFPKKVNVPFTILDVQDPSFLDDIVFTIMDSNNIYLFSRQNITEVLFQRNPSEPIIPVQTILHSDDSIKIYTHYTIYGYHIVYYVTNTNKLFYSIIGNNDDRIFEFPIPNEIIIEEIETIRDFSAGSRSSYILGEMRALSFLHIKDSNDNYYMINTYDTFDDLSTNRKLNLIFLKENEERLEAVIDHMFSLFKDLSIHRVRMPNDLKIKHFSLKHNRNFRERYYFILDEQNNLYYSLFNQDYYGFIQAIFLEFNSIFRYKLPSHEKLFFPEIYEGGDFISIIMEIKMFDYRMWAYISFYSKERQQEYINKLIYEIEGK